MSGKGGRPKGEIKKKEIFNKEIPIVESSNVEYTTKPAVQEELPDQKESIREAISEMLSQNLKNLPMWLEGIGESNPEKALGIFKDMAEYILPKQQRESGAGGNSAPFNIIFQPSSTLKSEKQKFIPESRNDKAISNQYIDEILGR